MKSRYASLLNELDAMASSAYYATRKHVLREAERAIVNLERDLNTALDINDVNADSCCGSHDDPGRVLAVGEKCAGKWSGRWGEGSWECPCGARRPEDCRTETAKP